MDERAERVLGGDLRATARLISALEDDAPSAAPLLAALFPHTGKAQMVGITGAPGAGKSTLVDALIRHLRGQGRTIGVLAVDPSSPFGGGAILGDRIRMQDHASDRGVYIRSMGARGQIGGLARATRQAAHVLDAAGYEVVVVETVGVGQSELAIAALADTTVVVLTPGMGDAIQLLKAGILEIADIFVLNKADQHGTPALLRALRAMLHDAPARAWTPPVVETQAHEGRGIGALCGAIADHRAYMEGSGELEARRARQLRGELLDHLEQGLRIRTLPALAGTARFAALLAEVLARGIDPRSAALVLLGALEPQEAEGEARV